MTLKERAKELLRSHAPYSYVHNAVFEQEGIESVICADMPDVEKFNKEYNNVHRKDPTTHSVLFAVPTLTKDQEQHLFRKMNFLKFKSDMLRPTSMRWLTEEKLDAFAQRLREVKKVRDILIHCNLKLVSNLIKKRKDINRNNFNERLSDGYLSLFRAVDKFDYSKGFKFSTYAWWAVHNGFNSSVQEETMKETVMNVDKLPEPMYETDDLTLMGNREVIDKLMLFLDKRTSKVIRQRMGLGLELSTLKEIGDQLKVNKERVRQIEVAGLDRLRSAAKMLYPKLFKGD